MISNIYIFKFKMKTIFFYLLLALALCQNFEILSTSTCTNVSTVGTCLRWSQNGTIQQQLGSCFPANSLVMTPSGLKNMASIKRGDSILGLSQNKEQFTQVTSWFHHIEQTTAQFLEIEVQGGSSFQVSAKHNIATAQQGYVFAQEAHNTHLFGLGKVSNIKKVLNSGIYSPKTTSNNYFVYTSDGKSKVLAHCYAHVRNPTKYESVVDAIQSVWEMVSPSQQEVHPSYKWLQNTFSFLTQYEK